MLSNIYYLHEKGRRQNMEDNIFPFPGFASLLSRIFIVCDGVGGLSKGEEASRILCETMGNYLTLQLEESINLYVIELAVAFAIKKMKEFVAIHPSAEKMSTTLSLVAIQKSGVWAAWCGDSRIMHIREGEIIWQSKDHSIVQKLIDSRKITEIEALFHPEKNIILRSINTVRNCEVETKFISNIYPGDYILLCTDGILENINATAINDIFGKKQKIADKKKLFLKYCQGNTKDNYSMYLIQLGNN